MHNTTKTLNVNQNHKFRINKSKCNTFFKSPRYDSQESSQVSNGNKNRLDQDLFYQSNIERQSHLNPEDCKNYLNCLE